MTRYLAGWAASVMLLIGAIVLFNFIVDPYAVYRKVRAQGFNDIKPRAQQQGALGKRAGIVDVRPRALVLGNSRAEIGFDPAYRAWPAAARPVYNAALPGTGLRTSIDMLRYAIEVEKPLVVVVGIEFNDFLTHPSAKLPQALHVAPVPFEDLRRQGREATTTLLSLDALVDALLTIRARNDRYAATLRGDGFNPMHDYEAIARREGYHAMFRQRDIENARSYARAPRNLFVGASRSSPDIDALKALLKLARSHGIELKLVIYPYHVHLLETFHATGLWPIFEEWKRVVVDVVHQEATEAKGQPYVVWDFSGYHSYATESVPGSTDKQTAVKWYWEAGHFKKELGNIMLDRIFGVMPDSAVPAFSAKIDKANIESHLARAREQALRFAEGHPHLRGALMKPVSMSR